MTSLRTSAVTAIVLCSLWCSAPVSAQPKPIESFTPEPEAVGAFKGKVRATGLTPGKRYTLTLNGYNTHSSNEWLRKECDTTKDAKPEGYCDFMDVTADAKGVLTASMTYPLPKGRYRVKFFIKDPDNWLVVQGKDGVVFEVK